MSEWRIEAVTAETPALMETARELFKEYHAWLGEVICSVRLAEEIVSLPGPYAAPEGRLLLAFDEDGTAQGVVGVRRLDATTPNAAEIKRLYVRPESRGAGLGRFLAVRGIEAARELGYAEVVLTTLPASMPAALDLYRSLGFVETEPFIDHSHVHEDVEMLFMKRALAE